MRRFTPFSDLLLVAPDGGSVCVDRCIVYKFKYVNDLLVDDPKIASITLPVGDIKSLEDLIGAAYRCQKPSNILTLPQLQLYELLYGELPERIAIGRPELLAFINSYSLPYNIQELFYHTYSRYGKFYWFDILYVKEYCPFIIETVFPDFHFLELIHEQLPNFNFNDMIKGSFDGCDGRKAKISGIDPELRYLYTYGNNRKFQNLYARYVDFSYINQGSPWKGALVNLPNLSYF